MRRSTGEDVELVAEMARELEHDVRRCSKAIQTETLAFLRITQAVGAVSDDAGAEQRRRIHVGE
jgi:hypothetical protein